MTKLSENIKALRLKKGYTLEDLGRRVHTSRQTILRYENGSIAHIPYDRLTDLAKALGVTPGYLMGWEENLNEENADALAEATMDTELLDHIALLQSMKPNMKECVFEIARILSKA